MPTNNIRYRVTMPPKVVDTYTVYYTAEETPHVLIDTWDFYESIADRINPIKFGSASHRPPGPCSHNKVWATDFVPVSSFTDDHGHTTYMVNHGKALMNSHQASYSPRNDIAFNGWLNLLSPFEGTSTYQNLCLSAFNKQIQQVPTKTSVINFLFELLELKPIFKKLAEIPKHIRTGSLAKAVSGRTLSRRKPFDVAKGGANAFLAAEFQWIPFVSDIMAFINTMDSITKRLNFLRKNRGKEVIVRYIKDDCFQRSEVGTEVHRRNSTPWTQGIWLTDYQCDFVSTWKLFQDLKGLDDAWAELRAVFVYLGVNNPLKIVWNAIPFSFLVDWVAPVSQWLEKAAVQPYAGVWKAYDVTSSVHEVYNFEYRFESNYSGGLHGPEFKVHVDSYRRLDYLPLSLGAVDFSQLSDTQQKLALALGVSKVRV